jgi:hypothetical protein
MKLNTVSKWWDHLQVGLCEKFAEKGVNVCPLPYDDLTDTEKEIVYHYWSTRELLVKDREEAPIGISPVRKRSRKNHLGNR